MKAGFLFALMTVPGYSICLLRLDLSNLEELFCFSFRHIFTR